ncbi:TPA: hypothetical protein ACFRHS_000830 [Neisseria lactamica]|uniref:hypothetical protein n=1 Tax=Neisseria lactamica TaxID=486 RepID=UPI000308BFAD|nr:hypothetical protein [Neisseria lactamica]
MPSGHIGYRRRTGISAIGLQTASVPAGRDGHFEKSIRIPFASFGLTIPKNGHPEKASESS